METKVREIIQEVLCLEQDVLNGIKCDQELYEYGLDSIKAIEMVVFIEDIFNIMIDDDELLIDNLKSINLICELVGKKINN